jgi:hypothetical protein
MDIVSLIEKIPATFWGVIVGSFFSIFTVMLTNWSNTKRLRIQLEHDRNLKTRERELALRKEIYLAAAEAISAGMSVVGRLGDLNVSHDKLMQSFVDKSSSIAKVNVVAGDTTIKALSLFMAELTGILLRLSSKRIKLGVLQQRLTLVQEHISLASKERDRMVSLMKELNLAGVRDERQWAIIQDNFEFESKRTEELMKEQAQLQAELYPAQLLLVQECVGEVAVLNRLLTPVLSSARKELELPFDENAYTQVLELSHRKQVEYFEWFLQEAAAGLEQPQTAAAEEAPNQGVQPTASSVRSSVAPAFGSG